MNIYLYSVSVYVYIHTYYIYKYNKLTIYPRETSIFSLVKSKTA